MDITNALFLEMISGFEGSPIWLKTKDGWSPELYYDRVIGDFVRMKSAGKPRLIKFSEITEISFEQPEQAASEPVVLHEPLRTAAMITPPQPEHISVQEQIKRKIWLHSFAYEDRSTEIQKGVRNTPLEKEWTRMQNILADAKKNHVLREKADGIVNRLDEFSVPSIELCQMTGIAFAAAEDYGNASLQYEIAGDYQNAAYYAAKCGKNSKEYLIEVFRKWLLTGKEINKDVLASFFWLTRDLHRGRYCAETIRQLHFTNQSDEVKSILYYGLLSQLSDYLPDRDMPEESVITDDRIRDLLARLQNETVSEDYSPNRIEKQLHANELFDGRNSPPAGWQDDVCTGYIVSSPGYGYGFINENPSSMAGIYFNISNCSGQLAEFYPKHFRSLRGLKVVYKTAIGTNQGKKQTIAVNVEAAEDIKAFLQNVLPQMPQMPQTLPHAEQDSTPAEEKLEPLPEKNRYSGYIIFFNGSYGFLHKEQHTTKRGVYFYGRELDEKLKPFSTLGPKLSGLKVTCSLADSFKAGANKAAVQISAAEDIENFIQSRGLQAPEVKHEEPEIVDDDTITRALRTKSAPAVVQEFATTNKPLHALAALERAKDSFSYDKYVKHKIQLLQRTKSSDNELIQLLNYTITTSHDGAYIAHNLFFLGQVQFRCKQYSDVVGTMKQLSQYRSYMKTPSQYPDSLYLMAVSYYMLQDYTNSDQYAKELQKLGVHSEEVSRLLDRTFASEVSDSGQIREINTESPLMFDAEVTITPFAEKLIERFSFGSISLKGIPTNFDPWSSDCTIQLANEYIRYLIRYDKEYEQKNNPNAYIAMAKIQKWLVEQSSDTEKENAESYLRNNLSHALQTIARNAMSKSGLDIRVYLFYRIQQYKMSIRQQKEGLFNAYINAHYSLNDMRFLRISSNLRDRNYRLMMSDLLLFVSSLDIAETDEEKKRIQNLCRVLSSRDDAAQYRSALCEILDDLRSTFSEDADLFTLTELGSEAMGICLNNTRKAIRSKAESRQWDALDETLRTLLGHDFITAHEQSFIERVLEVIGYIDSVERNTQNAMKQNLLNQSRNQLDELSDDLEDTPTYILYSIFGDVLGILKSETLTMLAEVMSHAPNIEPVGSFQINVGLTDSGEFLLPIEFQNAAPAVQAKNLTILAESMTPGVTLQSQLPIGQNVDEGEKYSQSLAFRLDSPETQQVEISVRLEYSYDAFDNLKQANERRNSEKAVTYTVSFQDVPKLANRYREYAKQQTVKDKSMFFGREQVIAKLFEAVSVLNTDGSYKLRGGNGIVLYGQRRSGKTSLLYHLKEKICRDMDHTVVVDLGSSGKAISNTGNQQLSEDALQERNRNMTMETLYHLIISGIQSYIEDNRYDVPALAELYQRIQSYEQGTGKTVFPDAEAFMTGMNSQLLFNDFIKKFTLIAKPEDPEYGFRIVILIDEFTYFNTAIQQGRLPRNFMEIWKGIVSDSFITLIVAGQDNMVEFIEGYVNEFSSFHREWVTFLSKDASYKMVTEPIGTDRIDPDAADKLYRITAGSPFLLMDVCAELVDWMNDNKILKLSGSQPDDFLVGKYMKEYGFKQDLFEPQYMDAGRLEWTDSIKKALGLIARSTSKKVSSSQIPWNEFDQYALIKDEALEDRGIDASMMHEILERLVKRQVIEAQEGYQNRYRIKIPLCREWILRRGGAEYGNE